MIRKSLFVLGVIALSHLSLPVALACPGKASASTDANKEVDRKISSQVEKQDSGQSSDAYYEARKKALRSQFERFQNRRGNLEDRS